VLFVGGIASRAQESPRLAIPVEPISAIVDAFHSHSPQGNEQAHTFRLALIRDPRFADAVDDVVVEFGSTDRLRLDCEQCLRFAVKNAASTDLPHSPSAAYHGCDN
jgi:hypothetical protein